MRHKATVPAKYQSVSGAKFRQAGNHGEGDRAEAHGEMRSLADLVEQARGEHAGEEHDPEDRMLGWRAKRRAAPPTAMPSATPAVVPSRETSEPSVSDRASNSPVMPPTRPAPAWPLSTPTTMGAPMLMRESVPRRRSRGMNDGVDALDRGQRKNWLPGPDFEPATQRLTAIEIGTNLANAGQGHLLVYDRSGRLQAVDDFILH